MRQSLARSRRFHKFTFPSSHPLSEEKEIGQQEKAPNKGKAGKKERENKPRGRLGAQRSGNDRKAFILIFNTRSADRRRSDWAKEKGAGVTKKKRGTSENLWRIHLHKVRGKNRAEVVSETRAPSLVAQCGRGKVGGRKGENSPKRRRRKKKKNQQPGRKRGPGMVF